MDVLKGIVSRDIFLWIIFPKDVEITLGSFQIFSKFCGDIQSQGRSTTGINETGGKFCHRYHWCHWYGSKFAAGINDTGINDTASKFAFFLLKLYYLIKLKLNVLYTRLKKKIKEKFLTVQLVHKQEVKNASHHVLCSLNSL